MSVSIKAGTQVHIWDRVLTQSEIDAARAFLLRNEPITNCDCNLCTGKTALAPWWLSSEPVVAFHATEGWIFDGMSGDEIYKAIDISYEGDNSNERP